MNTMQTGFLGLLFLSVTGLAYGLIWLLLRQRISQERMRNGEVATTNGDSAAHWQVKVAGLAEPLARLALPKEGWESSSLRTRFLNAGWRNPSTPVLYFAGKAGLALCLPLLLAPWIMTTQSGLSTRGADPTMFFFLLAASLGYYFPNLVLALRISRQQRELLDAFPDAVDLIIVCIEAGLGLDAAIARCSQEIRLRSQALADELHLVELELRVGASREQALRNLALRTGLDDLGALVTMLIQADRFGTSIAESLRVHAAGLRTRRRQRAEEAAAKLPLKLLFPLIFCIFPSLMLVLLGPAVINIFSFFVQQ